MFSSLLWRYRNLLIVIALLLACGYTLALAVSLYQNFALSWANYAGLVAAGGCLVSYFAFRPLFKYFLGGTLLLGLIHVLNFLPVAVNVGISLGELHLGVQPFSLLLLVACYLLN